MKQVFLFASISLASGLLFTNLYTSVVDAASWGSDLPASVATARDYFRHANPGDFFRIFSPINQVLAVVALIMFWKVSPAVRLFLGAALVLYVATDVFTFAYFYPRNEIMFNSGSLSDTALLKETWSQWNSMNWLRTLLMAAGVVFSFVSLHKSYLQQARSRNARVNGAHDTETLLKARQKTQLVTEAR